MLTQLMQFKTIEERNQWVSTLSREQKDELLSELKVELPRAKH